MQYFPGIDPTLGVYADQDKFYRQLCNVNGTSGWSPYYNAPLLPSLTPHVLLNSEVIKQTIFGQETIFRNQVIELHRLYDKQRELLNELRNDFIRGNTRVKLTSSEYGLIEQKQSSVSWLSPSIVSQSVACTKPFHLEVGEKNVHSDTVTTTKCTLQQCELLDANCKKCDSEVLDLQLLATEYMDDEDDVFSNVAEATHPVRNTSPFSAKNDEHIDHQPSGLDIQEKGPHTESDSARPILFDLNEPFNFEEATPTTSNEELPFDYLSRNPARLVDILSVGATDKNVHESITKFHNVPNHVNIANLIYDHETGQKTSDSNPFNRELNLNSLLISADSLNLKSKGCDAHSGVEHRLKRSSKKRTLNSRKPQGCLSFSEKNRLDALIRVPKSLQLTTVQDKTESCSNPVLSPVESIFDFRRNPIAVQALPCTHASVLMKKKKSKSILTATWHEGDKPHTKKDLLNPMVNPDGVKIWRKGKKRRRNLRVWNVNQDLYRLEPLSPDNEECSPPGGDFDENLLGTQHRFYTAEDGDTEADVARIAAKAIVFLSAADVSIIRRSIFEPYLLSPDNPLHWFAKVVSVESEKELMLHNLDDFETMTLKLEDMNTEEQHCRSIIASQDEKLTLASTVSGRVTRARGKRSKKLKDFRGVILPGISSLSKHEVMEDFQVIEDLMVPTGTPTNFCSKKRSICSRGGKQSSYIASVVADNSPSPCLPLDLPNQSSGSGGRPMPIDWGKITRRRRGQRYPARKLTFSQLAIEPTLKAH